jgi:hypothetical protein
MTDKDLNDQGLIFMYIALLDDIERLKRRKRVLEREMADRAETVKALLMLKKTTIWREDNDNAGEQLIPQDITGDGECGISSEGREG